MRKKLSLVLATRNEEKNIKDCINSFKEIVDEIIVYDESSSDNTREIAKKLGAKVFKVKHESNFHITKQKAIEKAKGEWILQLDADERGTEKLNREILKVLDGSHPALAAEIRVPENKLFKKHTKLAKAKGIWKDGDEVVAFLMPRLNLFLGKPLRYAGVYPDPAIRLIKKGKAYLPAKSVHENMIVEGATAWLENDMVHIDSPTLSRYLKRLNRYTDLQATDFGKVKLPLNSFYLIYYSSLKPLIIFLKLYVRHKGFADGMRGFIWSAFSAMHYPIAYFKYYAKNSN